MVAADDSPSRPLDLDVVLELETNHVSGVPCPSALPPLGLPTDSSFRSENAASSLMAAQPGKYYFQLFQICAVGNICPAVWSTIGAS